MSPQHSPLYTNTSMLRTQNSTSHQPPKYMNTWSGKEVSIGLDLAVPACMPTCSAIIKSESVAPAKPAAAAVVYLLLASDLLRNQDSLTPCFIQIMFKKTGNNTPRYNTGLSTLHHGESHLLYLVSLHLDKETSSRRSYLKVHPMLKLFMREHAHLTWAWPTGVESLNPVLASPGVQQRSLWHPYIFKSIVLQPSCNIYSSSCTGNHFAG